MNRALITFAGLALSAGVASAEFVGITVREDKNLDPIAGDPNAAVPDDTRTFNLYAVFDGGVNDDVRNTVLSTGLNNVSINQTLNPGATFYQETVFGGDTAPSANIVAAFPEVGFDTFVTIGKKRAGETNPDGSTGDNTSPDPDFGAGGFTPTGLTGGWFNANPPSLQGAPEFNSDTGQYETILAQLSITGLDDGGILSSGPVDDLLSTIFDGQMSIFRQGGEGDPPNPDGTIPGAQEFVVTFTAVPTPGALALFGVAGLAAVRRRR